MISPLILRFFNATLTTLSIALLSCALGLALALIWALLEQWGSRMIRWITVFILSIIRGLPEILILFWVSYGLSPYFQWSGWHFNWALDSWVSSVLGLALLFSSYASQVLVSGFKAISKGQIEAGLALGLTHRSIFWQIIWPQSLKHALPGLGNLWLVLLKDTALVSLLGVSDVMNLAHTSAAESHRPFFFLLIAAGIYLLITASSQQILKRYDSHSH